METTTLETQEVKEVVQPVYVNPFCKSPKYHFDQCDDPIVVRVKTVEIKDKDTVQVEPVYEEVDIMAEVRAASNLAGVDYMKRLLASGQARPEDFFDDGDSGQDLTVLPETVHDARKAATAGEQELAELAKALGVPEGESVSGSMLEKYLTDMINKKWNEEMAAKSKKEGV